MSTKDKFKAVMEALRAILLDVQTVTSVDGEDITVETDGEITEGCKVPGTGDGAYKLPDGRVLIVKGETIEKIEEPDGGNNEGENPEPQNEGEGDDKKDGTEGEGGEGEGDNTDDEKDKEIEALKAEIERLKKCEEDKDKELENMRTDADTFQAKKEKLETLDKAITAAGGIDAVLKAVSADASTKSEDEKKAEAAEDYKRFCEIAKL